MPSQDLAVELYYGGAWHDITADDDVFTAPIAIKRGQSDEATQLRPASITMQLANDDDKYRTSNPLSPLYGVAGRNTPARVSVGGVVRGVVEAYSWSADQSRDFRRYPKRGRAWVDVEGGGLLQRIAQWTQVVESTMVKGMLSFGSDLVGVWPLEDVSTSTILSQLVSEGTPGAFTDVTLGDSERPAGSARSVKLGSTGRISGTFISSTASGWQVSFAFKLPALPGSSTYEELFTWYDSTGRRWTWEVNNANYGWTVYGSGGSTVLASLAASYSGAEPNQWVRVKMKATVSGSTITYEPTWYAEGTALPFGTSGTFSGTSTGGLATWAAAAHTYNVGAWYTGVFGIDNASATLFNTGVIRDFNGHAGETAGARFARLMGDAGLAYTIIGNSAESTAMGGQPAATLADLFKEIVSTEDALLFDDIDAIGLVLLLRNARYNQAVALDLTPTDLPALPVEVTDDLNVHNVVTASQRDGGSVIAEDTTSPLSNQPPPDGVGEYRQTVDVNVADETDDLPQQANWWLRRGTVNLPRFPQVTVNLGALDAVKAAEVEAVDVGDVITITGMREYVIRLYVLGYTETIRPADGGKVRRTITFTCAPDDLFKTNALDAGRLQANFTIVFPALDATSTTLTLFTGEPNEQWRPGPSGVHIMLGGEEIVLGTIGARTGTNPYSQVVTGCTRAVNGIQKAHTITEFVKVVDPIRLTL